MAGLALLDHFQRGEDRRPGSSVPVRSSSASVRRQQVGDLGALLAEEVERRRLVALVVRQWPALSSANSSGNLVGTVLDDPGRRQKVPVPAAGMELHHRNMLHSSSANRGTKPRSAMVIQYRAADQR